MNTHKRKEIFSFINEGFSKDNCERMVDLGNDEDFLDWIDYNDEPWYTPLYEEKEEDGEDEEEDEDKYMEKYNKIFHKNLISFNQHVVMNVIDNEMVDYLYGLMNLIKYKKVSLMDKEYMTSGFECSGFIFSQVNRKPKLVIFHER